MNLGLHTIQYPSGKWGFVGSVPLCLSYEKKDGSPITKKEIADLAQTNNPAMTAKSYGIIRRVFDSEDEAKNAAREHGFTI